MDRQVSGWISTINYDTLMNYRGGCKYIPRNMDYPCSFRQESLLPLSLIQNKKCSYGKEPCIRMREDDSGEMFCIRKPIACKSCSDQFDEGTITTNLDDIFPNSRRNRFFGKNKSYTCVDDDDHCNECCKTLGKLINQKPEPNDESKFCKNPTCKWKLMWHSWQNDEIAKNDIVTAVTKKDSAPKMEIRKTHGLKLFKGEKPKSDKDLQEEYNEGLSIQVKPVKPPRRKKPSSKTREKLEKSIDKEHEEVSIRIAKENEKVKKNMKLDEGKEKRERKEREALEKKKKEREVQEKKVKNEKEEKQKKEEKEQAQQRKKEQNEQEKEQKRLEIQEQIDKKEREKQGKIKKKEREEQEKRKKKEETEQNKREKKEKEQQQTRDKKEREQQEKRKKEKREHDKREKKEKEEQEKEETKQRKEQEKREKKENADHHKKKKKDKEWEKREKKEKEDKEKIEKKEKEAYEKIENKKREALEKKKKKERAELDKREKVKAITDAKSAKKEAISIDSIQSKKEKQEKESTIIDRKKKNTILKKKKESLIDIEQGSKNIDQEKMKTIFKKKKDKFIDMKQGANIIDKNKKETYIKKKVIFRKTKSEIPNPPIVSSPPMVKVVRTKKKDKTLSDAPPEVPGKQPEVAKLTSVTDFNIPNVNYFKNINQMHIKMTNKSKTMNTSTAIKVWDPKGKTLASGDMKLSDSGIKSKPEFDLSISSGKLNLFTARNTVVKNCYCLFLRDMKIFTKPDLLLGSVKEIFLTTKPSYVLKDSKGNGILKIISSNIFPICTDNDYVVQSKQSGRTIANIVMKCPGKSGYVVTFFKDVPPYYKLLILAASMMINLEYEECANCNPQNVLFVNCFNPTFQLNNMPTSSFQSCQF